MLGRAADAAKCELRAKLEHGAVLMHTENRMRKGVF